MRFALCSRVWWRLRSSDRPVGQNLVSSVCFGRSGRRFAVRIAIDVDGLSDRLRTCERSIGALLDVLVYRTDVSNVTTHGLYRRFEVGDLGFERFHTGFERSLFVVP
jgi:hypothetical protein